MENKEFMKMVNENHERAYQEYVKSTKRKNRKEKAKKIILLTIAVVGITILFTNIVKQDKKLINECMAQGNSEQVCKLDLQH